VSPHQAIAHYKVTAKLGEGGMGEVYRATDTKLNRDVAIKILPDEFVENADRLARFTREAQVLASLNHPNIAAIYGVEERAIVMELVEGQSPAGPMTTEEAIPVIDQLIDALEYAHEKGVIHRDLKPANLKLTPDGRLKVLDFGLARALSSEPAAQSGSVTASPTLTMQATVAGIIMGTAAYMSPEQARGQLVDKRADIWSFGVVVYELLTGKQLFDGGTVSDTLAAVLRQDLDLDKVPPRFRRLVRKCLTRDPRQRLRDISGARLLLEETSAAPTMAVTRRSWIPWAFAALFLATTIWLAVRSSRPASEAGVLRASIPPPDNAEFAGDAPIISPDGRKIAFAATSEGKLQLWLRGLDEPAARALPGTEGAVHPFWSPDSESIAFFASGKLKKIRPGGGPPFTICDALSDRGGAWGIDGTILFTPGPTNGLMRVSATGGAPVAATSLTQNMNSHRWPEFLPDGRHFLLLQRSLDRNDVGVLIGDLSSGHNSRILSSTYNAAYGPPGWLLFFREGALLAQSFDASSGRLSGEAQPLVEQVQVSVNASRALFSASRHALAYFSGDAESNNQHAWYDMQGHELGKLGSPSGQLSMALSPDGNSAVEDRQDNTTGGFHLWVHDLNHGTESRLTSDDNWAFHPLWSPDSQWVLHARPTSGGNTLAIQAAGGAGREKILLSVPGLDYATDWSRDGRFVALSISRAANTFQIWILPMKGLQPGKAFAFLDSPANQTEARFSPDGKWLAFASEQTSRREIYVTDFPEKKEIVRISDHGGGHPVWHPDGKRLFYYSRGESAIMQVDLTPGARLQHGAPRKVLGMLPTASTTDSVFEIHPDGKRLLVRSPASLARKPQLNVVVNWQLLLRK